MGFGLLYQTGLVQFSEHLARLYVEPRIAYYNASSNDTNFGNLSLLRFSMSVGYRAYELPFKKLGQRIVPYAGFDFGVTWFNHLSAGSSSFSSLLGHLGLNFTAYSTSLFAIQLNAEVDFESQSNLVMTPSYGFRTLGRFW